ncbi:hypothetical protein KM043_002396 [Ampulex compressa]|nr:hypothetical protein KM043_002396 [Ampulex compressa]
MCKLGDVWQCIIWNLCGILILVIGVLCIVYEPLINVLTVIIQKELELSEDSSSYKIWMSPIKISYKVYFFNVTNPDEVLEGELPKFVEMGPYVYDEVVHKHPISMDDEYDEIVYTMESKFQFNQKESGKAKENDKIMLLNPAYMGVINTLAHLPPNFMMLYGPDISHLFSKPNSVFIQGKAGDILFNGLEMKCDAKKHPQLLLICNSLKGKSKPPIIRNSDTENVYLFSFFHKLNSTMRGPLAVNRGTRNISRVGDLTSVNKQRVQNIWRTKECNTVRGSEGMKWPPMDTKLPIISSFSIDICKKVDFQFKEEVIMHGILGWRYEIADKNWEKDEIECYCPKENNANKCLPRGLLDISGCQKVPVIFSEPHFLNGDPELLEYARGLQPDKERHLTYIVIEPITGMPLAGFKRMQLNLRLSKQPLESLSNVSEGYFPLIWCDEGSTIDVSLITLAYQVQRLKCLLWFLQWVPSIIGIYVILAASFVYIPPRVSRKKSQPKVQSISTASVLHLSDVDERAPRRD